MKARYLIVAGFFYIIFLIEISFKLLFYPTIKKEKDLLNIAEMENNKYNNQV